MIPDRLQYFLNDFWNFENFTKSRPSEPVLLIDYLAYLLLMYGFLRLSMANQYHFRLIHITFGSSMALSVHSWHFIRLSAYGCGAAINPLIKPFIC